MAIEIKKVTLIGLGVLGAQIALQTAAKGYQVTGFDPMGDALNKYLQSVPKTAIPDQAQGSVDTSAWFKAADKIELADELAGAVSQADLVIEAVPENLDMKLKIWAEMDAAAPDRALLATNSSSMPVSRLEGAVARPQNCLNLHFYQMVSGRYMADVMGGSKTPPEVLEAGCQFIESLGLVPLKVNKESLGFCFNRVWRAVKRETLHMWAEGFVDFRDVDKAWMIFNNTSRGPFAIMDAVGLDVVYDIEMVYYRESGDKRDHPPQRLKEMVDSGQLGMKSGKGFYSYPDPEFAQPSFLKG